MNKEQIMNTEQERAAFEWWASDEGENPRAVERVGECYKLAQIQSYWMAWKARAALQSQPQETIGYVTRNEEGDPAMLFLDLNEAKLYCEPGEEPEALVLAGPAPQAAVSVEHATLNLQPSSSMHPVATAFFTEKGEVALRLFDRKLEAMMERIAALLYEETTGESWTVADVDHSRFARAYYRRLAHKVAALASHRKQGGPQ